MTFNSSKKELDAYSGRFIHSTPKYSKQNTNTKNLKDGLLNHFRSQFNSLIKSKYLPLKGFQAHTFSSKIC